MRFGKHKGCQFCIGNCHYHNYASSTFANEFLLNEATIIPDPGEVLRRRRRLKLRSLPTSTSYYPSCSSGRLSKTIYYNKTSDFNYEDDPGFLVEDVGLRRNLRRIRGGYSIPSNSYICSYAQFPEEEGRRRKLSW